MVVVGQWGPKLGTLTGGSPQDHVWCSCLVLSDINPGVGIVKYMGTWHNAALRSHQIWFLSELLVLFQNPGGVEQIRPI